MARDTSDYGTTVAYVRIGRSDVAYFSISSENFLQNLYVGSFDAICNSEISEVQKPRQGA